MKILATTAELVPKLLPKIQGLGGGRVPVSEQSVPRQRDVLEGHLKGNLFSLPSLQEFSMLI